MSGVAVLLATVVSALALGVGGVVLLTVRSWRTALQVLLELLVAAGLLRLVGGRSWPALATAVAVIALRRLLWADLGAASSPPSPSTDPSPTTDPSSTTDPSLTTDPRGWVSRSHPHRGSAGHEPDVTGRIPL
ncbi:hypothetical protein AB0K20_09295 [Micromonospora matsumotoense]|uniref:hypothetical protein n=1 Tax=Micromonospora matsumotoense TaxID=121616 RepID=UPI00343CCB3E